MKAWDANPWRPTTISTHCEDGPSNYVPCHRLLFVESRGWEHLWSKGILLRQDDRRIRATSAARRLPMEWEHLRTSWGQTASAVCTSPTGLVPPLLARTGHTRQFLRAGISPARTVPRFPSNSERMTRQSGGNGRPAHGDNSQGLAGKDPIIAHHVSQASPWHTTRETNGHRSRSPVSIDGPSAMFLDLRTVLASIGVP